LQAGYTDFHYLRPIWQRNTEKDALLGVSMTGIASGATDDLDLKKAAEIVNKTNEVYAKKIGINVAARTTCVKPAGTTSLVLGTSSGIHAWHNDYYLRRFKLMKDSALYTYLLINHPELIEDSTYNSKEAYACIPIKAPEGAVTRNESPMNLLRRIKRFSDDWIKPGHRTGNNTHNVSATVNLKKVYEQDEDGQAVLTQNEWPEAVEWMWENRDCYNGLSMFPFDSGTYVQAPHEDISKEEYETRSAGLHGLDLKKVVELEDGTNLNDQAACAGNNCIVV
jgi:ribonucleoside-diphosphate reductase alpha chain